MRGIKKRKDFKVTWTVEVKNREESDAVKSGHAQEADEEKISGDFSTSHDGVQEEQSARRGRSTQGRRLEREVGAGLCHRSGRLFRRGKGLKNWS